MLIAIERYLAICHGLWHRVNATVAKAALISMITWIVGIVLCVGFNLSIELQGGIPIKDWFIYVFLAGMSPLF